MFYMFKHVCFSGGLSFDFSPSVCSLLMISVLFRIMWSFKLNFYPGFSLHPFFVCLCSVPAPGKPAEDEVKLGSLKLKPNTKIMMMGTREESLVGGRMSEK